MSENVSSLMAQLAADKRADGFSLVHPLDDFYARTGQPLPPLNEVSGEAVPEPYKKLLVHRNDMTPTLEKFHQHDIHLRLIGRRRTGDEYFREVVLLLDGNDEPVEFGAIKIRLDLFPPGARDQVLEERRPLGHILQECRIPHVSQPRAFIRLASDPLINDALKITGAQVLYGRRNTLFNAEGGSLAEIVEILPPAPHPAR